MFKVILSNFGNTSKFFDCCVCQTDLHTEDCVACDVCLNWYHLRCIGLRFAPKKKPTGVAEIA